MTSLLPAPSGNFAAASSMRRRAWAVSVVAARAAARMIMLRYFGMVALSPLRLNRLGAPFGDGIFWIPGRICQQSDTLGDDIDHERSPVSEFFDATRERGCDFAGARHCGAVHVERFRG